MAYECIRCHHWIANNLQHECIYDELEQVKEERDEYKRLLEQWINDYDKLKEKYEPLVLVESEK